MAHQRLGCLDLWVWPAAGGVRCWTHASTQTLNLKTPWASGAGPSIQELRDRGVQLDLRVALAEPFATLLAEGLNRAEGVRLHLGQGLAQCWQDAPFEWLRLAGEPLFGRLVVERAAPVLFEPALPIAPSRPIAVLNLLPLADPIQPADALADGTVLIYDGVAAVEQMLADCDLTALAALIVIAHGSECDDAFPFRLPDGRPWTLPVERRLPPLVILMACGTDAGNLIVDGRRLLQAGAQAVLAPIGRPCPQAAGAFLARFLQGWRAGRRIDELLAEAQQSAQAARGARLLRLLGRGDLRMDQRPILEEEGDADLVGRLRRGERHALAVLIERLTLRALQQDAELDWAEQALRRSLGSERAHESGERWLGEQLAAIDTELSPLARAWVLPLEILLAEAYDHRRLPALEHAQSELQGAALPAPFHHYRAKLYYRTGRYALALQEVAAGLQRLAPQELCQRGLGLLGHLLALLIDLDLPGPAALLGRSLDDCLGQQSGKQVAWERHKLRDRLARIALRQGQSGRAVALYWLKRAEAAQFGGSGQRELAWLLYIESWRDPLGAALPLAREVETWLDGGGGRAPDPGNADDLYLIRAYAAWCWRSGEVAAARRLAELIPMLEERLYTGDAGPPGFALAYLHLSQQRGAILQGMALPSWMEVATVLEEQRYLLELAAFESLLGHPERALELLDRFASQRLGSRSLCLPAWIGQGIWADWERLIAERAAVERQILGRRDISPELLLDSGLLPL